MDTDCQNTLQSILDSGKKEFLNKGFKSASLRNVVKDAGVTTGAFYGYFTSKEELFYSLVREPAETLLDKFKEAQNMFAGLPPEEQPRQMCKLSGDCMDWMVEYIYANFEAFKLILCFSDGTKYEDFIHTMVEIEVNATQRFISVLRGLGHQIKDIDRQLEHILASGFFSGFFEIVIHDMPKEQSIEYVRELREFYTAGWQKILGL